MDALGPLSLGLHHVAIVVADLDEARSRYVDVLGFEADEPEFVPDQRVNVLVCRTGGQRIELVAPASEDSPVTRFLEKRGGGLHHLAYLVSDLEAALARLRGAGWRLIDDAPRPGAHGTRIAFVHPSSTGGVLTELVEDRQGT
ncbi:MAG TPA: methylmalonyl-CoA epimerase [Planctomycetes bacterium]|nr:methylmalonyl-CoA epimerase [Planctomycetota bacterium]